MHFNYPSFMGTINSLLLLVLILLLSSYFWAPLVSILNVLELTQTSTLSPC